MQRILLAPWLTDAGTTTGISPIPRIEYGQALRQERRGGGFLDSHAAPGKAGFKPAPTGANGCPPATSPTGGRTRGYAPTVGPASIPLIPSFSRAAPGRAGFKPAPTEPRYAVSGRTRGVTLTPRIEYGAGSSASSGQAPPSPVEGEGVRAPFHALYSVV